MTSISRFAFFLEPGVVGFLWRGGIEPFPGRGLDLGTNYLEFEWFDPKTGLLLLQFALFYKS